jgi:hypothetical protein
VQKITIPNLTRIRASADTTVADSVQKLAKYVNANTTPTIGNRKAAPSAATHPIIPKAG